MLLDGVRVLSELADILPLVKQHRIEQVKIAIHIPSLDLNEYEQIINLCNQVVIPLNQTHPLKAFL